MTDDDNANVMRGIVLPGQRTLLLVMVIIIMVKEIDTMTWECQLRTAADKGRSPGRLQLEIPLNITRIAFRRVHSGGTSYLS